MLLRFAVFILALTLITPAIASTAPAADPYAEVLNEAPSWGAFYTARYDLQQKDCESIACAALIDMWDNLGLIAARETKYGDPIDFPELLTPQAHTARLEQLIRAHPRRHAFYCAVLTKLARHYPSEAAAPIAGEEDFAHLITELAIRISTPSLDCIGRVMAAFPDDEPVAGMIVNAREACEAKSDLHRHCAAIQRR